MQKRTLKSVTRGAASTALCAALALGTAGIASAHDVPRSHHDNHSEGTETHSDRDEQVGGIVTALGTNSVTIQRHAGTPVTFTTTATTNYFVGTIAATAASIAVGENVDLTLSTTSPVTVNTVAVDLAKVEGRVVAVSGNTITLGVGTDAKTVTVGATTSYTLGGAASALSAIVVGSQVEVEGLLTSPTSISATNVKIELARLDTRAKGAITALGTNSVTIQDEHGAPVTFTTSAATTYTLGEVASSVAGLMVGQDVELTLSATTPQTVTAVEVRLTKVEGHVTAINGNTITLGTGPDAKTVTVDAATAYTLGGAPSTLSAIVIGSHLEVAGVATINASVNATSVKIELARLDTHAEGTITALGTNTVTIQGERGAPVTFTTSATTTYNVGNVASTLAALAVGQNVELRLTATAPQTVTTVDVDLVSFEGLVTAISGNTITLGTGTDAKTVTVSSSTTYGASGSLLTLGSVLVGSHIEGRGIATSSTVVNATHVSIELSDHDSDGTGNDLDR